MPDHITIEDLEVLFHVGVPDEERTEPQRLLITIELTHDLEASGIADSLAETIDYFAVCQAVKALGQTRSWKLIESLADDICMLVLDQFSPSVVRVVVKKFILPDTRWVSIEMIRPAKNRQDSDR
jgi:dihydroneopterin aldolase